MSRIDDLIAELCPDGVEYHKLGNLVLQTSKVNWDAAEEKEFRYIDLTSVNRITHEIQGTEVITVETAPSRAQQIVHNGDVLFGTTRPMLKRFCFVPVEFDGQIASTGYCVLRVDSSRLLSRFLFHLLGSGRFYAYVEENQRGASYPAIPDSAVKQYRIPVPPMKVQREIVRILDTFSALEAELEAELEARRTQYAYYRDSLLGFENDRDVPWVPLGEAGELLRGKRFTKADYVTDGIPCIHYGEIYTEFGPWTKTVVSYLRPDLVGSLRFAHSGDVILVDVGETVEDVGKAVAWLGDTKIAIHDHCYAFRHDMNPAFVSYYMQTQRFHREKAKHVARTKVKTLLMDGLAKVMIPVPRLDEQERIVSILDSFDALVNDLSVGLPAELAARRTQYEHYRDRLLTFEEAPA